MLKIELPQHPAIPLVDSIPTNESRLTIEIPEYQYLSLYYSNN
jgi:hypothetical protein